jgi:ADP-heptose:LPS heptosyltransferase
MELPAISSILVYVGCDQLGDGLMKLPFVRTLRAAFPDARITWLAGRNTSVYAGSLAPLVVGLLDDVTMEDVGTFAARCRTARQRFDLIIDTQRGIPTALRLRRIPHRRIISPCLGFLLSGVRPGGRNRKSSSLAQQLLDLATLAAGRPVELTPATAPLRLPADVEAEAERLLPAGSTYVGLAPGAGGRHKCWPLESYLKLGRRIAAAGYVPAVILGPDEAEWISIVRNGLPLARLPLQDASQVSPLLTIALGKRMAAATTNDSGVGHMLAASDLPLVSLFGPTPPAKFAPVASRLTVIRAQDFGSDHMAAIPVQAVWDAVAELLAKGKNGETLPPTA